MCPRRCAQGGGDREARARDWRGGERCVERRLDAERASGSRLRPRPRCASLALAWALVWAWENAVTGSRIGWAATRGVEGDDWNERVIAVRVCSEDGVLCERGGVGDDVDVVRREKYAGRLALLRLGFELIVVS